MPKTSSPGGSAHVADDLGGLAQQLEQVVAAAARGGHLIHHAARRAHDEVLDLLRRAARARDRRRPTPASAASASNAATSSAADELTPLPTGTSDRTSTPGAVPQPVPVLAVQHDERARDVGGPGARRIAGQQGARARRSRAVRREDLGERDADAAASPPARGVASR